MKTGENQTSSIGACWPPAVTSNQRVRGFYPEVVHSASDTTVFVDEFESQLATLSDSEAGSRLSVRLVGSMAAISTLETVGVKVEGALPIAGEEELYIAYTAWNHPARRMSDEFLLRHRQTIAAAMQKPRVMVNPEKTLAASGFLPRTIDQTVAAGQRRELVPKFIDLYGKFGYEEDDVKELLANDTNTICYVETEKGEVVSTVLAEKAVLELDNHPDVVIVELTEAITKPELRGQGLYSALSGFLVDQLLLKRQTAPQGQLDVIYGESNLSSPGVIHAARKNGRKFSHHDGAIFGIYRDDFGILEQNFSVNDGSELRPYNDFALSYLELS